MKSAIVTGATGFIGSWLTQDLLDQNYSVTVIVRNQCRLLPEIRENCKIVEKTLLDVKPEDLSECDVFFHLAWNGVAPDKKNSLDIQLENIKGSLNVLESANVAGCNLFQATGTVAEYALCDNVMDLAARQTPNDFYGAAKVSSHYFMEVRARQLNQPFIWSIIPSTFGERRIDSNIVTYTIKTLLNGEKPVYGNLEQMWDFLYVKDVVRALRLIGEKGIPGKIYGIGSGQYKPLRSFIEEIRDIIDPELSLGIGERPTLSQKTFSSCVNIYDLIADTGFIPAISFREGIKMTIKYFGRVQKLSKISDFLYLRNASYPESRCVA